MDAVDTEQVSQDQLMMLGKRLREIRVSRGLSLRKLADATNVSASFLSQLERGASGASIGTLIEIAAAMRVSLSDLFSTGQSAIAHLITKSERPVLDAQHGYRKTLLTQRVDSPMEIYGGEFAVGGSTGPHPYVHGDSFEVIVVFSGTILLQLGKQYFSMSRGDSIEFQSSTPHRVENQGEVAAELFWIVSGTGDEVQFVTGE